LVSANTEERQAAETLLVYFSNASFIGDKGFLGDDWQAQIYEQTGNTITTPKRRNQKIQHPDGFEKLLNSVRERRDYDTSYLQSHIPLTQTLIKETI